jgi:alpha-galactosidase
MRRTASILSLALAAAFQFQGVAAHAADAWLDSMNLSTMTQDWGKPHARQSVEGHPLTLHGKTFDHGVGTHANSDYEIKLDGRATQFSATVGVDDDTDGKGSVTFQVIGDGRTLAETKVLHGGDAPVDISVPLRGVHTLVLSVTDGGDGISFDHADWADARITIPEGAATPSALMPATYAPARMRFVVDGPQPAIHGPRVVGATPGHPFLFLIPATGRRPLTFTVRNLPAGLHFDSKTGIISGSLAHASTTTSTVIVRGPRGTAKRTLTIVGGKDKLAQTPPMGWNSWNAWAGNIDQEKMEGAADSLIKSGLAAHGYQYVNIDDTWEDGRSASGEIESNKKFPNMAGLAAYVHARGLKVGLYSSPGPKTCAGFEGSYQHELQDAQTYAKWGFDYLKYDWCSYGGVPHDPGLPGYELPYQKMGQALGSVDRDIFFSLCQYGMGDVWTWGASMRGNCWRTTGDINDSWGSLHGIYESQAGHEKYAGPGHWNDPDMLVVGRVGWGNPHPTRLTPNEQILHMSMWSLFAAPLIIGCDLQRLDKFTLALLTNDEVIDIDQDPLGRAASLISKTGGEVWARPLSDGSMAVGLVNPHGTPETIAVTWKQLGLSGPQRVRDLWLHQDQGRCKARYSAVVPAHGCVLIKVSH